MIHHEPVTISASSVYLFHFCKYAYALKYRLLKPAAKHDSTKLLISKTVHALGAQWLQGNYHPDGDISNYFDESANENLKQYKVTIRDLTERYISLLKLMKVRQGKFLIEEYYGSSITKAIPVNEFWSFSGAADIVLLNDKDGDKIFDAKWSYNLNLLNRFQIDLYATIHELILKRPVSEVGFIVFGPQKLVRYRFDPSTREYIIHKVNMIAQKISSNELEAEPSYDKCYICEYANHCEHKLIFKNEGDIFNGADIDTINKSERNIFLE